MAHRSHKIQSNPGYKNKALIRSAKVKRCSNNTFQLGMCGRYYVLELPIKEVNIIPKEAKVNKIKMILCPKENVKTKSPLLMHAVEL